MRHLVTIASNPTTWPGITSAIVGRIPNRAALLTYRSVNDALTNGPLPPAAFVIIDTAALTAVDNPTDLFLGQSGALVYTHHEQLTGDAIAALALSGLAHIAKLPDAQEWLLKQLTTHLTVGH